MDSMLRSEQKRAQQMLELRRQKSFTDLEIKRRSTTELSLGTRGSQLSVEEPDPEEPALVVPPQPPRWGATPFREAPSSAVRPTAGSQRTGGALQRQLSTESSRRPSAGTVPLQRPPPAPATADPVTGASLLEMVHEMVQRCRSRGEGIRLTPRPAGSGRGRRRHRGAPSRPPARAPRHAPNATTAAFPECSEAPLCRLDAAGRPVRVRSL